MFPLRYFAPAFFAAVYFAEVGAAAVVPIVIPPFGVIAGKTVTEQVAAVGNSTIAAVDPPPIRTAIVSGAGTVGADGSVQLAADATTVTKPWARWTQQVAEAIQSVLDEQLAAAFQADNARDAGDQIAGALLATQEPGAVDVQAAIQDAIRGLLGDGPTGDNGALADAQRLLAAQLDTKPFDPRDLETLIWTMDSSGQRPEVPRIIIDLHANRVNYAAGAYPAGTLYYETDRTVYYIVLELGGLRQWWYFTGQMRDLLANIPTDLGTTDINFLFYGISEQHTWRWTSLLWTFAPGDQGSGQIVASTGTPNGGLWALCDGSAATLALGNATTTAITTPDLTGDIFLMGGSYSGTRRPAVRAKWEATAKTETAAHTHDFGVFTVTSLNDNGAGQVVQSGSGVTVAAHGHNHDVPIGGTTATESPAHSHVLNDTNAQLKVPSDANGGVPLRISLQWYIRL